MINGVRFSKNTSCYIGLMIFNKILINLKKFTIHLNYFNSFNFLLRIFELLTGLMLINEVRFAKNTSCYIGLMIFNKIIIHKQIFTIFATGNI